jgi:hypothetical protein
LDRKINLFPPPFRKWYCYFSHNKSFFNSFRAFFALILTYFAIFYPLTSYLLSCSFPFLPFFPLSSHFFNICHPFLFPFSYFPPKMISAIGHCLSL